MMLSTLKLTTLTGIGREEEKKLSLILTYLIELPEASEFIHPVDWEELELNDYPLVVKHPMNLLKVQDRLKAREYRAVEEVLDHIQLIWDNCKAYNPEGPFNILADKMERAFKKMIRNYLPSIQVVVPKPLNSRGESQSTTNHPPPQPQQTYPTKSQPKPAAKPSASLPALNPQSYQQAGSANEPNQSLLSPEQIPHSEKNRFNQRLKQLSQQQLAQVVLIVQQNCPEGFKEVGSGRFQMILDSIDLQTFRRMNQRIDDLLDCEKNAITGAKKVKI